LIINFDDIASLSPMALLWFGLIGLINFVIGRRCSYSAIRRIGATRASSILASAPLIAMIIAITFIGESVNAPIVIGTISIVGGLYLVITSE